MPVSYALFALALGTLLGLVIRRTLPAIAATVVAFIAVRMAFQQLVRPHLVAPVEMSTPTFDQGSLAGWILSTRTVDSAGRTIQGFENQIAATCNITRQTPDYESAIATCAHRLGIHDITRLHPANHFWILQYYEFGIFVAIAAALTIASLLRPPSVTVLNRTVAQPRHGSRTPASTRYRTHESTDPEPMRPPRCGPRPAPQNLAT